jgi:hypothetical protein
MKNSGAERVPVNPQFSIFPDQNPRFEQQPEKACVPFPGGVVAPGRGSQQKYRKQPHAK